MLNATNYGIQCVNEAGAVSHRVINNRILVEKRNEIVNGIITQSALGLQTSSALIECEGNWIAAWRENGSGGFVINNIFQAYQVSQIALATSTDKTLSTQD